MKKLFLRDIKNKKIEVNMVRYFNYQNDHYLIYALGEIDEKNFMKLYVVKVMEELGSPVSKYMTDEWEWNQMPVLIKLMLKEIKEQNIKSFEDLDIREIENLKITKARDFKLLDRLVKILSGEVVEVSITEPEKVVEQKFNKDNQEISEINIKEVAPVETEIVPLQEAEIQVEKPEVMKETENIYDITPVINTINNAVEELPIVTNILPIVDNLETTKEKPVQEEITEVEDITPFLANVISIEKNIEENNGEKEMTTEEISTLRLEDILSDNWEPVEIEPIKGIPELVMAEPKKELVEENIVDIPKFMPLKSQVSGIDEISNTSHVQMLELENDRLKHEIEDLKQEVKVYREKYQKIRDFIQREI